LKFLFSRVVRSASIPTRKLASSSIATSFACFPLLAGLARFVLALLNQF
jgi:hypothetical protein